MTISKSLHIAIAGCGPAGMAAALFLKKDGHQVEVFDQMERPRPIGSGLMLQPTGLAVLRAAGLSDEIIGLGARIDSIYGRVMPSDRVVLDVKYASRTAPSAFGLAVHRSALFDVLFRAMGRAKVPVHSSRHIVASRQSADRRIEMVDATGEPHGPFDLVVDAMGGRSTLSSGVRAASGGKELPFGALWATVNTSPGAFSGNRLEQRYMLANRMVGIMPIGRIVAEGPAKQAFFWSIKPQDYQAWRDRGLDHWKVEVSALWPATIGLLDQITDPDQLTLARYNHFTLKQPFQERLVQIGDSAHSTSPQLGQGANMALLDAYALSKALRSATGLDEALNGYARLRRMHVRLYQSISVMFTPAYQSDSLVLPWLRDNLLWPLSRIWPAPALLSSMVRGRIVDPLRILELQG